MDCRAATEEERQVPEMHLDYMLMGREEEGKTVAFWVARDRPTRAVLSKGCSEEVDGRLDM